MPDTAMLVIRNGPEKDTVFKLGTRSLSIGREKGNLIQLAYNGVSRRHAMIRWSEVGHRIVDLDSTNGTLVNGKPTNEAVLKAGDVVLLGELELEVVPEQLEAKDSTYARAKVPVAPRPTVALQRALNDEPEEEQAAEEAEEEPEEEATPVVDLDRRQRRDTSELEFAMFRIKFDPDYLETATSSIADHIAPDRVFVFLKVGQSKVRIVASWFSPTLEQGDRDTPPMLELVSQAMHEAKPQLVNSLPEDSKVATVAVVNLEDGRGAIYIDSLRPKNKPFLAADIKIMGVVAKAISGRMTD